MGEGEGGRKKGTIPCARLSERRKKKKGRKKLGGREKLLISSD